MVPFAETSEGRRSAVSSFSARELASLVGPAEAQYGEQALVLSIEGAEGLVACGTEIVDGDANDGEAGAGQVSANFVWTNLIGETGYRLQADDDSLSYVTEDNFDEKLPDEVSQSYGNGGAPGTTYFTTARVIGHIGHAPGHGATPIAGDVVSNECTMRLTLPPET